jgi:hypothetical protein
MRSTQFVCVVSLATAVVPAAALAQSQPTSKPQPLISADAQTYDFGKVMDDAPIEHAFKVLNVGRAPLQIKRVRSTCGCTAVNAQAQTLPPDGSAEVKVRLNAKGLVGKVSKTVYVECNDPSKANYGLTLKGEVIKPIAVTPSPVMFDRLDRKQPSPLELTLSNNTEDPLSPSDVTSTARNVTAVLTEIAKGKQYKLTLTATPPYAEALLRGKVSFKTGMPKRPEFSIDFMGRPPAPIEIQPATLSLGVLNAEQEYRKTARIVSLDDQPIELTEVSTSNWRFSSIIRPLRDGREYEIEVTARPPYEWGMNRAMINFGTRSSAVPRLTLQAYGEMPPPILVSPSSLLFRDLSTTKGGEASVTLKVADAGPVQITSCRSTLEHVKPRVTVQQEGKLFVLTATAVPPFQPGQLQGEVVLESTHPRMKTIKVPIQSFMIQAPLPAVSVIPDPVLTLPSAGATPEPTVSRFIVRANGTERARVTEAVVSNEDITVRLEPQTGQEDRLTFVYITVPSNAVLKPEGETISIHTDNKQFPLVVRRIVRVGGQRAALPRAVGPVGPPKPPPPAAVGGAKP